MIENEVSPALDLLTMGRISVDLYPEQIGVSLAEVRTFRKLLGGTATNVAVAAARLGRRSAVLTKVGAEPFGAFTRTALAGFGVDPSYVLEHPTLRTPLAFCEIFPPDHFPLLFYREPVAPDLTITLDEVPAEAVRSARILWVTGSGFSVEPSRAATFHALRLRDRQGITILDLDHRPSFWADPAEACRQARAAIPFTTAVVGNRQEVAVALGRDLPPADAARALLDLGADLAVVKQGPAGVLAATRDATVTVAPVPVEVVNGLGAGDAFGGALCHGLLSGWDLHRLTAFANAAGALVAGRLGCADDMPTAAEVEALLAGSSGVTRTDHPGVAGGAATITAAQER